jgi:hypothetical protein
VEFRPWGFGNATKAGLLESKPRKTKKSRQSCGLAKQLGTKKCSANPPPAKRPPFGRVLYSKAPSPKNTTGKVQTQTAVPDQRLPTKTPNKAAMVRLRNHSRASIPAIECARPIRCPPGKFLRKLCFSLPRSNRLRLPSVGADQFRAGVASPESSAVSRRTITPIISRRGSVAAPH